MKKLELSCCKICQFVLSFSSFPTFSLLDLVKNKLQSYISKYYMKKIHPLNCKSVFKNYPWFNALFSGQWKSYKESNRNIIVNYTFIVPFQPMRGFSFIPHIFIYESSSLLDVTGTICHIPTDKQICCHFHHWCHQISNMCATDYRTILKTGMRFHFRMF